MTGNWIRPPRTERRPRWRLRIGLVAFLALFVASMVAINAIGNQLPSETTVGSNLGPTPCDATIAGQCARHLATTTTRPSATTRAVPTTSAPVYGPENPSDFIVIDGKDGHVYRVSRTALTSQMLWIATHGQ